MKKYLFRALFLHMLLSVLSLELSAQSFIELNQTFPTTYYGAAVWADYDKDGHLDFFVNGWEYTGGTSSSPSAYLFKNNGDNTFTEVPNNFIPLGAASAAWGDMNNDGYPDLAIAGNAGSSVYASRIYRNNGDGTFTDIDAGLTPIITPAIAWGDLNNDGLQDLIITGGAAGSVASTKIYLNNGNESFTAIESNLEQLTHGAVALGDLNKDGMLDIVLAGRIGSFNYTSKVYINQGDAVFEEMQTTLEPARYSAISLTDYSGDGFLDILLAGSNNSDILHTSLYKNTNGTGFQHIPTPMTGIIQGSLAWGDVNNDGFTDVLLTGATVGTGATRATEIFLYQGNDIFVKDNSFTFPGLRRCTAYWGDFNNDGKLDVLASGYYNVNDYITKIFINNLPIANTSPVPPQNLQSAVSGGSAILSWDAASDNETSQNSLTYSIRVGSNPGAEDILSPLSDLNTGRLHIPRNGNQNLNLESHLNGLEEGTYYWSVQTIDGAFGGSTFASEQVFVVSDLLTATFQVTSDGQPLSGASIQIGTQTKETDAGGLAIFSLAPGNYNYIVSHPFHQSQNGSFTISDQSITIPVQLIPLPTFELLFTLSSVQGPVQNAAIEINNQTYYTGPGGEASVTLLEGNYTYYIYEPDYNQIWGEVFVNQNTELNLEMIPLIPASLPFSESFELNILPLHWQKFDESLSGNEWFFEDQRAMIDSDAAGSGVNVHASLISSPIDIQGITGNILLKLHHFFNRLGMNNFARIHYSVDNGAWVLLAQFDATVGSIDNFVWTEHLVDGLPAQALQIRFRFEYDDGFAWAEQWMLEKVVVEEFNLQPFEMTLSEPNQPEITQTPIKQFTSFTFGAKGKNTGVNALENVYLNVYDGDGDVTNSVQIPYFPPSFELFFEGVETFTPSEPGIYQFWHRFLAPGIDLSGPTNEAMIEINISDSTFATDNGLLIGGVGGSSAITFGNLFQLIEFDKFTSFTIGWGDLTDNTAFTVSLFQVDMSDSTIIAELYQSESINRGPEMAGQYITWNLAVPISLTPGFYALMINQLDNVSVRVGYDGTDNGLFWRKTENNLSTFENTEWGNIAIRMNVYDDEVGIHQPLQMTDLRLYPNPANKQLMIENNDAFQKQATIYSADGRSIRQLLLQSGNNLIDVSTLKNGFYFIQTEKEQHKLMIAH